MIGDELIDDEMSNDEMICNEMNVMKWLATIVECLLQFRS